MRPLPGGAFFVPEKPCLPGARSFRLCFAGAEVLVFLLKPALRHPIPAEDAGREHRKRNTVLPEQGKGSGVRGIIGQRSLFF